jgi:hypothetical protein
VPNHSPPHLRHLSFVLDVFLQPVFIMEETNSNGSSTNVAVPVPQFLSPRHVPDVPEDVDLFMDHLNDPNYDLHSLLQKTDDKDLHPDHKKRQHPSDGDFSGKGSDYDTESQHTSRYSTTESRVSAIEFDECVSTWLKRTV